MPGKAVMPGSRRGTVLVTGVGRRRSIGAGLAVGLAEDGWDLVLTAAAAAGAASGRLHGLVMSHCESVDSSILSTTVESWDRHFHVNARAAWLLIKAFAEHLPAGQASAAGGRIVALTSDHSAHNLPYGASKGALDRIVIAAAVELADRGIRANVINPGPVDTGWMTAEIRQMALAQTPAGRLGTPADTASLVRF